MGFGLLLLSTAAFRAPPALLRAAVPSRAGSTPSAIASHYDRFDWDEHWYPVSWARDCTPDAPTKVTLFDKDYAVVIHSNGAAPLAVRDRCPHRLAALSEGRITSQGWLQCAYHGWAFDAEGGCRSIPQQQQTPKAATLVGACVEAYPVQVVQGMVWIFPGRKLRPGALSGSTTEAEAPLPAVPVVPEMEDGSGYRWTPVARDLPIDYSILVENILDPDHGLFAHQAPAFDLYSAARDAPQVVAVHQLPEYHTVLIESKVEARPKLTASGDAPSSASVPEGTNAFQPPCKMVTCRRDPSSGDTKFLACFWVCPVGVGRSRFLAAGVAKGAPFAIPRWLVHVGINNFLDQDTHLLATQQPHVLSAELEQFAAGGGLVRRQLYKYRSPTERMLLEVGSFLDANVPSMPDRYAVSERFLQPCPPRAATLDRWAQHTEICPDSQRLVSRLRLLRVAAAGVAFARALSLLSGVRGSLRAAVGSPAVLALSALAFGAHLLQREFSFKYVATKRDRDLRRIPKKFSDERLVAPS